MTAEQAVAVVEAHRKVLKIRKAMEPRSAELAIVGYKPNPEAPGPPEDRVAWIVTLTSPTGWVRVDVDDTSGQVLGTQRTP